MNLRSLYIIGLGFGLALYFNSCKNDPLPPLNNPEATVPIDSLPMDSLPIDTLPVDTLPIDTLPVDTLPVDTLPIDPPSIDTVYYSTQVWPIIQEECRGCHVGPNAGAGILLTNYEQVRDASVNGQLLNSILYNGISTPMPPVQYGPLPDEQVKLIEDWIEQGALNN